MAKVMRVDRTIIEIDAAWMAEHAQLLHYAQASDGVWVPTSDMAQYERGERIAR